MVDPMSRLIVAPAALALLLATAAARAGDAAGPAAAPLACQGQAFIADTDPAGTNVRVAPGGARGRQRMAYDADGRIVELAAAQDGWLRVTSVEALSTGTVSRVDGWVHGSMLAVHAAQPSGAPVALQAGAASGSPIVARIASETPVTLLGCRGAWRQVQAGRHRGWLAPGSYCWSPVTTCP